MTVKIRKPFAMKQFSIAHNKVALPVTSDACLFGAMIEFNNTGNRPKNPRVLDIGTGTGLLCFMLAQKNPEATFVGIDIHPDSVDQANENREQNPFANRIHFEQQDVLEYANNLPFDVIVCNPPFFKNQLPSTDEVKRLARHSNSLNLPSLLAASHELLQPHGEMFLLYPCSDLENTLNHIKLAGFQTLKTTFIQANSQKQPHLVILQARKVLETDSHESPSSSETIVHYNLDGKLTVDAIHYLKEFYTQLS
jgi:tRNA1Val (adenine37-N6)-methyltransferase